MNMIFALSLWLAGGTGVTQQIDVSASVSSTSVQVAEPLEYLLEVYAPTGATVVFPEIESTIGDFDVLDHTDRFGVPSEVSPGESSWKRRYTLESIQTGRLVLPEQKIELRVNGKQQFNLTDAISITVESVLENRADPMKFRDIKGLIDVEVPPSKSSTWLWWMVGSTGAMLAIALSLFFLMATRKSWTMPDQWATNELRRLSTSQSSADELYGKVINVLRGYLDHRYGLDPNAAKRDLVSSLRELEPLNDEKGIADTLASILNKAEAAKFAGQHIESHEINADINAAVDFIEQCEQWLDNMSAESVVN